MNIQAKTKPLGVICSLLMDQRTLTADTVCQVQIKASFFKRTGQLAVTYSTGLYSRVPESKVRSAVGYLNWDDMGDCGMTFHSPNEG